MRTRRLLRSLAVLAPLAGVTSTAHAATLTVCPSGCAYSQIQPAVDAASSGDTISIGAGTYYGAIDVTKNVTLAGAGAGSTTIQGIHLGYPNNTNDRAIMIDSGVTVRIQGVTVTSDSTSSGDPSDGGILNFGTLTVTNSAITNNRGPFGGGIANEGTLTVTNSVISRNFGDQTGGGITNYAGATVVVTNSTISGNYNLGEGLGGGIANEGTLTVTNSAISGNSSYKTGGGISNDGTGATATVTNSTISDNSANDYTYQPGITTAGSTFGGGIFNQGSTLAITNSTISDNWAEVGGGIENDQGSVTLSNNILAKNTAPVAYPDCRGALTNGSGGHNLIGDGSSCSGLTNGVNGDQVGTDANPIDPKLGPLQDNGGPTQTMALLSGSPAISAGDATTCESLVGPHGAHDTDQRGQPRNSASRGTCDVGAFDTAQIPVCPSGCAYSQIQPAIDAAYSGDTISIAAGAYNGGLSISKSLILAGAGAGSVTINGGNSVVYINSGVTVRIQGVTITGGNATYYGGGIMNNGALTLDSSTISGNTTNARISYSGGGGIANVGALTVTNSTISGNSAQVGGGIYTSVGSTVTLANSTISGNSAYHDGGIYNEGAVTLTGTILAQNTASMAPDCGGTLTGGPGGHNLLGDNSDCSGLTNGVNGDQVGTDANPIDPKLGPLQDNGGPTQTQALLPGSAAIDAIPTSTGLCPATDQRGVSRPDDNESFCDIGAYESNYTLLATSLSAVSGAGTYGGTATLTATLTAGATPVSGKTITFTLNSTAVCGGSNQPTCPTTDNNGVATLQSVSLAGINAGSYATAVGAGFAGDTGYTASNATGALTVGKATQTITFGALANHTYGDSPFTVSATASSGLPVSFSVGGADQCTISGSTVTITGAGSCTVTASQAGGANYTAAPQVQQSFAITPAPLTITASAGTMSYGGTPPTITPSYSGFVNGDSAASLTTAPTCVANATATTAVGVYPQTTSCGGAVDPNYTITYVKGTLTVTPAPQAITFTSTPPNPAVYGGSYAPTATGGASGNPVTFTAGPSTACASAGTTGATITLVGVGTCTVTASQASNGNYSAASVTQSFAVAYPPLSLTPGVTSSPAGKVTTGSVVTVTGTLSNHTTVAEAVTLTATFSYVSPSGQRSTISATSRAFTLAAGQTLGQPFRFTISKYVPRGAYTVALTATDTTGDTASGSAALTIV